MLMRGTTCFADWFHGSLMLQRTFSLWFVVLALLGGSGLQEISGVASGGEGSDEFRPNVLWITCEDTGPQLGCYGDRYAETPHLDRFAERSLRFDCCWSNAPVCAPARTTLITGIYPTSYGAQPMRSSVPLPAGFLTLPQRMRAAGYYCSNNNKEDYNFGEPTGKTMWDTSNKESHWRNRGEGQPFFSVFNFTVTHEGQIRKRPYTPKHDPKLAPVPPYHPEVEEVRLDWAQYYDRITEMDRMVGKLLGELQEDGLSDSTVVFFFGDHGCGLPRGKRWLYETGLRVPMLVHLPKRLADRYAPFYQAGTGTDRLVSFVDLVPTVLDLCGVSISDEGKQSLHGKSFFDSQDREKDFLFGFRDRMDERIDSSRVVRNGRYAYIRNFMPDRPQGAYLNYMFQTPTTRVWFERYKANELNAVQSAFWQRKPVEELYDLQVDPYQIHNLGGSDDAMLQEIKGQLALRLKEHMLSVGDTGGFPEGWHLRFTFQDRVRAIEAAWASGDILLRGENFRKNSDTGVRGQANTEVLGILAEVKAMLGSSKAVQRYWGGIAARGLASDGRLFSGESHGIDQALIHLLQDPDLEVRAVVAETLCRMSKGVEKEEAQEVLVAIVEEREGNWGGKLHALNALCDLVAEGVLTERSVAERVQSTFESQGKSWSRDLPERYREYLGRLVERLASLAGLQ